MSLLTRALPVQRESLPFRLAIIQRTALAVLALIGAVFVAREVAGTATPASRAVHALMAGYSVLLLVSPVQLQRRLGRAMPYLYVGVAALVRLYVLYFSAGSVPSQSLLIGSFLCEPLIYMLFAFSYPPRRAFRDSLASVVFLAALTLPFVVMTWYGETLLLGSLLLLPGGFHAGLVVMLYAFAGLVSQFDEVKETAERLEQLAYYDALTKVPNRRHMTDLLQQSIVRAETEGSAFGVILLDVDHFKQLNDRYGHDVGDRVLQGLATRIQSQLRMSDVIARWGGEEFVVLAGQVSLDEVAQLAKRLCSALGGEPLLSDHLDRVVTISCGVAVYQEGDTLETLLKRADCALYDAKDAGRNCYRLAS